MRKYDFDEIVDGRMFADTPVILSIGVFDGVHRGHRKILNTLHRLQEETPGSVSMVVTFSMNPKDSGAGELDTLRLRAAEMETYSINSFTVIDFSEKFSRISAVGFAHSLAMSTDPRFLVVGEDFRCGHPAESTDGKGFVELLRKEGRKTELITVDYVLDNEGEKISSTRLRSYIRNGEIDKYIDFAGDPFRIDLDPLPCRLDEEGIVFERMSVHQLLPPPGAFDAVVFLDDGSASRCRLILSEEFLMLRAAHGASVSGFMEKREAIMAHKNYISIIRSI